MKNFLIILVLSLFGGMSGAYFFVLVNDKYSADLSEAAIPTPTISVISNQDLWQKIISEASESSVGVQVFQANRLVKQGSGVIISSDGLIVTVADLAVPRAVYQIFYEDKILRGTVAAIDYDLNLVLIKTPNSYSNVADLSTVNYQNGQEISLVGKIINLSKSTLFSQKGSISYITDKNVILDTLSGQNLLGAGVVNMNGDFIGVSYLRANKVGIVKTSSIEDFFRDYISKNTR